MSMRQYKYYKRKQFKLGLDKIRILMISQLLSYFLSIIDMIDKILILHLKL